MNIEEFAREGFEAMLVMGGAELKIGIKTYQCVPDDDELAKMLEDGGFMEERSFHVYVRKSDFTTAPEINQKIKIGTDEWRILEIMTSPGDPCLRFKCGTIHK